MITINDRVNEIDDISDQIKNVISKFKLKYITLNMAISIVIAFKKSTSNITIDKLDQFLFHVLICLLI